MAKIDIFAPQEKNMVSSLAGVKITIASSSDCGKALTNSSVIPTPDGYRCVGDIKIGDYLFDDKGMPTKVIGVFPQGEKEVWEVEFKDGRIVRCCSEHLWEVFRGNHSSMVKTTKELKERENITYYVPLTQPVNYSTKDLFIPPYVLGLLIGDGSFRVHNKKNPKKLDIEYKKQLEYSSQNAILPNKIADIMNWRVKKCPSENYTYVFYDKHDGHLISVQEVLADCPELINCYSHNKFIPEDYMYGDVQQRFDLLAGLMDTDGRFTPFRGCHTDFTTTSTKLMEQVKELCYSLGMTVTVKEDSRTYKYTSGHCYNIFIMTHAQNKLRMTKIDSTKDRIKYYTQNTRMKYETMSIKSIRQTGVYEEMTCFTVESSSHLFLVNDYIVTHNTMQSTRFPKPLLLMAESGGAARAVPKFPIPDWQTFVTIVKQLVADPQRTLEVYQTIIIDTTEELVARVEESVARRFGVTEVGMVQQADSGNPNGYSVARAMFKQQINLLTSIGLTVIFLTHIENVNVTDPFTNETYTKVYPYNYSKEKGSTRFVLNLCDFVITLIPQGVDPETQKTIYSKAICKETNRVFARSRFTQMQTYIEKFTAENLINAIETAIKKEAENEGAGLVDYKSVDFGFTKEDYIGMIQPYFKKLIKLYPDYVHEVVEQNLGEGRKISSASDDEVQELANIYSDFNSFCCDRGIVVED